MFPDLPPHLQMLNTTQPSPPQMSQDVEDAVWEFLHTDELFRNFGNSTMPPPATPLAKEENPLPIASTSTSPPVVNTPVSTNNNQPADLKSFIAQFAPEATAGSFNPANLNFTGISALGLGGVNPTDVIPGYNNASFANTPAWGNVSVDSPEEGRVSGAKKLKQLGAGQAEIEEDKRRRNTEASARFRLKKKEREQALEQRAKELEAQVAQLSADKASLEKENCLLKAIVLNSSQAQSQLDMTEGALALKRKRE